jgi:hypothetical protein
LARGVTTKLTHSPAQSASWAAGARDCARIGLSLPRNGTLPDSADRSSRASFPHTDVRDLDASVPALTTQGLRPCLIKHYNLRRYYCARATSPMAYWPITRLRHERIAIIPQFACALNAQNGGDRPFFFIAPCSNTRAPTAVYGRMFAPTSFTLAGYPRHPRAACRHCHRTAPATDPPYSAVAPETAGAS